MKDIRLKFYKKEDMIYISHLDLMRLIQRVFRRSGTMLKHTEGYNPQPKISFATALSLGTESEAEYMDIELEKDMELNELIERLNSNLPDGIKIKDGLEKTDKSSIMALIEWGTYEVSAKLKEPTSIEFAREELKRFLALEEIIDIREKKKKKKLVTREVNIKELIKELSIEDIEGEYINFKMFLKTGSSGNLKPEIVIKKLSEYTNLDLETEFPKVKRLELFIEKDDEIVTPLQ